MSTVCNTVQYCCVCKGGTVLYAYNNNGSDQETETLAALCLEKAPLHHKWYFQTMANKTFAFLMEDEYVYFAIIISDNLDSSKKLEFLEHLRDAFKKAAKKGLRRIVSNPNSLVLQEQLSPVIRRLIKSLEHVTETTIPSPYCDSVSNAQLDIGTSTKAPLLGKPSKQDKRKMRDHVVNVRESGVVEEHRKSADKQGIKVDSSSLNLDNRGGVSLTKELSSVSRSRAQMVRNKWCRQVRIVLAIDAAVCLVLFVVWMVVCRGTECIG